MSKESTVSSTRLNSHLNPKRLCFPIDPVGFSHSPQNHSETGCVRANVLIKTGTKRQTSHRAGRNKQHRQRQRRDLLETGRQWDIHTK